MLAAIAERRLGWRLPAPEAALGRAWRLLNDRQTFCALFSTSDQSEAPTWVVVQRERGAATTATWTGTGAQLALLLACASLGCSEHILVVSRMQAWQSWSGAT